MGRRARSVSLGIGRKSRPVLAGCISIPRKSFAKGSKMNAHLDYLRLATWNTAHYSYMASEIMRVWTWEYQPGKWQQYTGHRAKQFFMGTGEQDKRRHHVVHASGSLAERMRKSFMCFDGLYGTRVDIQMTVPKPSWVDLAKLHKNMGKKLTTLISSEENSTLYIGSRESDKFARLYEKPLNGKMYLRMEFELKGRMAAGSWNAILAGESVGGIYARLLIKSKLPGAFKSLFENADDTATDKALRAEIEHDNKKILKWIQSLDASMMRHMNNHEIGDQVVEIVRSWAMATVEIDNLHNKL